MAKVEPLFEEWNDDWDIRRTVTDVPEGESMVAASLIVLSERSADDDTAAVLQLDITAVLSNNGQIVAGGNPGEWELRFLVPKATNRTLKKGAYYWYRMSADTDAPWTHIPFEGFLIPR